MRHAMSDLTNWKGCPRPTASVLEGEFARLERLNAVHHIATGMKDAVLCPDADQRFTYLLQYPPANEDELLEDMLKKQNSEDPLFYAIVIRSTGRVAGYISLMRITPEHGVCEIGNVYMGPLISRTRVSTETVFLLLRYAFDELGYRRVEWKCNNLNEPSKRAALRFGFSYEGLFRKHLVIKGANRDTAWFAMTDDDWTEGVKDSFVKWLDDTNFDVNGCQINALASLRNNA